ncbi:hypothetical protein COLO4_13131 [Corchorus olitorius]|uniref:Bet v I/Major latex protein domain-containing protein n=1 Tax=Corchorus olitorius TaxID=93759 RepID=A0A1R3JY12_9ROSI|nr:hypothetical protein COLO4_13131 [Corchorus olitorius]
MSSSLSGKLEGSVEIDSSPEDFHEMFFHRPHHMPNACGDKVQGCDLHEGDAYGQHGAVVCFRYTHDGKAKTAKHLVEVDDPKTHSVRYKMLEGDLLEEYKSFVLTYTATPKPDGKGSIVKWVFEYEKKHEGIPHPESLMDYLLSVSKDMGTHVAQGPKA